MGGQGLGMGQGGGAARGRAGRRWLVRTDGLERAWAGDGPPGLHFDKVHDLV